MSRPALRTVIVSAVVVGIVAFTGDGAMPLASAGGSDESTIRYEVSGTPGTAEYLTYEKDFTQAHEANVTLPWSTQFKDKPPGHTLLVSAQGHGTGSITCRILVDGKLVSQATASGQPARTVCAPSR